MDGVLVHVGLDPVTDYLEGVVPLDKQRQVVVNEWMETEIPGIFAAGDIRSQSPGQVSTAVGDGAAAGYVRPAVPPETEIISMLSLAMVYCHSERSEAIRNYVRPQGTISE